MAGFDNDVVYANNADFSTAGAGGGSASNGLQTDGQLWIGTTAANVGGTHVSVGKITSPLGTVAIGYSSPNITVDVTGGANPIEKIALQTGTTPVVPTGGILTFNGVVVAAGTNPVRTDGTGPNTMALEVQTSQAIASTDATKIGLASFNSSNFNVDANGFVSATGTIPIQFTGNTGTAAPSAGNINIFAASTAAGTSPASTSATGSTVTVNIQKTQALAATDATKVGLANFDSAAFDVDANGFVQLNGGGIAATSFPIQANTAPGTNPVVPTAAGAVTVNGAVVANHSVVLESRSRAANAYNLEVQYATSAAATDGTKSGVAHFNSAQFSVDASGFVSSLGAGFPWVDTSGTVTAAVNTGYFITATTTSTLPASPAQGDVVRYFVDTTQILTIKAAGTQVIRVANTASAAGGTSVNTQRGDAIELVYRTSGTQWCCVNNPTGAWTTS